MELLCEIEGCLEALSKGYPHLLVFNMENPEAMSMDIVNGHQKAYQTNLASIQTFNVAGLSLG